MAMPVTIIANTTRATSTWIITSKQSSTKGRGGMLRGNLKAKERKRNNKLWTIPEAGIREGATEVINPLTLYSYRAHVHECVTSYRTRPELSATPETAAATRIRLFVGEPHFPKKRGNDSPIYY